MKRKVLLSVLVILLILALTGCMPIPPNDSLESMTEEDKRYKGRRDCC